MVMESPTYFGESCIKTADMYKRYQAASIAEFNAYRVDLDMLAVCCCGKVIILDDGEPKAMIDASMIERDNVEYQRFLKKFEESKAESKLNVNWDFVLGFMRQSLDDRGDEEAKCETNGTIANYVAIRKERYHGEVRKRVWFDGYSTTDIYNWRHASGILNIDNCSFKPDQVNILHSKQYVVKPKSAVNAQALAEVNQ